MSSRSFVSFAPTSLPLAGRSAPARSRGSRWSSDRRRRHVPAGPGAGLPWSLRQPRPSQSRPDQGLIKVRITTLNQNGEAVQVFVANLIVPRRSAEYLRQQHGCGPATANRR